MSRCVRMRGAALMRFRIGDITLTPHCGRTTVWPIGCVIMMRCVRVWRAGSYGNDVARSPLLPQ